MRLFIAMVPLHCCSKAAPLRLRYKRTEIKSRDYLDAHRLLQVVAGEGFVRNLSRTEP